jgi:hypothetical protein
MARKRHILPVVFDSVTSRATSESARCCGAKLERYEFLTDTLAAGE